MIANKQPIPTGPICTTDGGTQGCSGVGRLFPVAVSGSANLQTLLNRPVYFRYPFFNQTSSLVLSSPNLGTGNPIPILDSVVFNLFLESLRGFLSPTSDFSGTTLTLRLALFDTQNNFGWFGSPSSFYPGQVSYYSGSGSINPGATYLQASILTMTVVRFNSAFPLPSNAPPGSIQWDVRFNWPNLPTDVTLLMLPPALSPVLTL
jgi:hypothetical protein